MVVDSNVTSTDNHLATCPARFIASRRRKMAAPAPILLSFFPLKKPEIQKQKCLLEKKSFDQKKKKKMAAV